MAADMEGHCSTSGHDLSPFGAYVCVVDIDVDTGVTEIRRFYALDDCGTRINPTIIEGQVHGGLTEALASAALAMIGDGEGKEV